MVKEAKEAYKTAVAKIEADYTIKVQGKNIEKINERISKLEKLEVFAESEEHKARDMKMKVAAAYKKKAEDDITNATKFKVTADGDAAIQGATIKLG
jgi:hypothetical protein